jgi:hypothetical protein
VFSGLVCDAILEVGDRVSVEDEREGWSQIKANTGRCKGMLGWAVTKDLDGGGPLQLRVGEVVSLVIGSKPAEAIIDGLALLRIRSVHKNGVVVFTLELPNPYGVKDFKISEGRPYEFDYKSHRYRLLLAKQADFGNQSARVALDRISQ